MQTIASNDLVSMKNCSMFRTIYSDQNVLKENQYKDLKHVYQLLSQKYPYQQINQINHQSQIIGLECKQLKDGLMLAYLLLFRNRQNEDLLAKQINEKVKQSESTQLLTNFAKLDKILKEKNKYQIYERSRQEIIHNPLRTSFQANISPISINSQLLLSILNTIFEDSTKQQSVRKIVSMINTDLKVTKLKLNQVDSIQNGQSTYFMSFEKISPEIVTIVPIYGQQQFKSKIMLFPNMFELSLFLRQYENRTRTQIRLKNPNPSIQDKKINKVNPEVDEPIIPQKKLQINQIHSSLQNIKNTQLYQHQKIKLSKPLSKKQTFQPFKTLMIIMLVVILLMISICIWEMLEKQNLLNFLSEIIEILLSGGKFKELSQEIQILSFKSLKDLWDSYNSWQTIEILEINMS